MKRYTSYLLDTALAAERQRVLSNPRATDEDRRWASCYDDSRAAEAIHAGARLIAPA